MPNSTTAQVASDMLKVLEILSDTTVRRSTKTILEINNFIIYKFFKDFTNHRKKTKKAAVFSSRPFPNIL